MHAGERRDSAAERVAESLQRRRGPQRQLGHRLHGRERVLDPVVELPQQELPRLFGALARGDVDHEAAQRARSLVVTDHVDDVLKPHEATVGGQHPVFELVVDGGGALLPRSSR